MTKLGNVLKRFDEGLNISNTHYRKYFDLVKDHLQVPTYKESKVGNNLIMTYINDKGEEVLKLTYKPAGRFLELVDYVYDGKSTKVGKQVRDTHGIRDLLGSVFDNYFKKYNIKKVSANNVSTGAEKYKPKTKEELQKLIEDTNIHLGDIDTSLITDMTELFNSSKRTNEQFEGIETWDTSKVTSMKRMFSGCTDFNQNINNWDVSRVTNMESMFAHCSNFNQPLDKWNTSKVTNMATTFCGCINFNQPLNNWNTGNVTNMGSMFLGCKSFNQPLDKWNTSKVTEMSLMFFNCESFNQSISKWNTSKVTSRRMMF